jgi:hypothetical protein
MQRSSRPPITGLKPTTHFHLAVAPARPYRRRSRPHPNLRLPHRASASVCWKRTTMEGSTLEEDSRPDLATHRGGVSWKSLPLSLVGASLPCSISGGPSIVPPPRTMVPPLGQIAPHPTDVLWLQESSSPAGVHPLQDSPFPDVLPHSLFNVTGTSSAPPPRRPHPSSFTEVSAASLP